MSKKLLYYEDVYDEEGEPYISDKVTDEIQKLSEIVCNNHFGYVDYHDREDIIVEGILKALEMIYSKKFDPDYGAPLRNFIYTGMRNEMKNYLYRKKREYPVEEFYGDQKKSPDIVIDTYEVDYNLFKDIIDRFKKRFGDYSGLLVDELEDMGFDISNYKSVVRLTNYNKNLLEKMVVMSIWKIRESYL